MKPATASARTMNALICFNMIVFLKLIGYLFIPCISTIAVLMRETGVRYAAMITVFTLCLGIGLGALTHLILL